MKEKVTTLPPHVPFLETLADYLVSQNNPVTLAHHTIFLPTQRACSKLADILCDKSPNHATLLPKLIPLGIMDEDDLSLSSWEGSQFMANLPPILPEEQRLALLTQMVQDFYQKSNQPLKTSKASFLASQLIQLINQVQTEGLDFNNLKDLVPEDYAKHWQITLNFLEIIGDAWPQLLAKENVLERAEYQRRLLECHTKYWEENPPTHPIIAAGSTGSIPATAKLLKTIANLPKGMVILPGFDTELREEVASSHPQHTMQNLLKTLEIGAQDVTPFLEDEKESKTRLLREIFQPSPQELPHQTVAKGLEGVSLIECAHLQEEATSIAIAIREALETPEKTVSLVTPDRELAQRVIQELKRWNIRANDSAGTPFTQTPLGNFCLLTASWIQESLSNVTLLATLKHPHGRPFKLLAQRLEKDFLRKQKSLQDITLEEESYLPEKLTILKSLRENASHLAKETNLSFKEVLSFHKELMATLADSPELQFQENEETHVFQNFLEKMGGDFDIILQQGDDYGEVLKSFLSLFTVRQKYALHPRLSILGLIEARLIPGDLVILGGLNESTWPPKSTGDPWFNQAMRKKFGLPDHERRVGLSSLDFIHAYGGKEVLLTRALRSKGTPTVPSRLLVRLESYLERYTMTLPRRDDLMTLARTLHTPEKRVILPPPTPRPPATVRPQILSITDVTTLMHDPYSIYAKHVLRLKPLRPLEQEPGPMEFGIFIHQVLEHLIPLEHTKEQGLELGQKFFGDYFQHSPEKTLWWHRFERILDWVLDTLKQAPVSKSWTEVKGSLTLGNFTLIGKADRLDLTPEGITIIDYKTGAPPTQKDLERGLAPQLPLEALILTQGQFEDVPKHSPNTLSFWRLSGDMEGGVITTYSGKMNDLLKTTLEGLKNLIETFSQKETPYLSIPYETGLYDDYHHLARIKEWSLNGGNA